MKIIHLLRAFVERRISRRPPDFVIGSPDDPYLQRWWLIPRNPIFNLYAHRILRDDDDRALHDHPWWNVSIILRGGYVEVTNPYLGKYPPGIGTLDEFCDDLYFYACNRTEFKTGALIRRGAAYAHRIELKRDDAGRLIPALTLFITGPRMREWGFFCKKGWIPWQRFTATDNPGEVGRGCDG